MFDINRVAPEGPSNYPVTEGPLIIRGPPKSKFGQIWVDFVLIQDPDSGKKGPPLAETSGKLALFSGPTGSNFSLVFHIIFHT